MEEQMGPDDPWDEDGDEELEAEIMRADRPFGADDRGTTEEEALAGLDLEEGLARERPEARTTDEVVGVVDDGVPDAEGELTGEDSVERDDFASPEESALSIRTTVPGATDHDDPHPADEA